MNNYKEEMDELYKNIQYSQTSAETEEIFIENINSIPNITTGNIDQEIKMDLGSVSDNDQLYSQPKKVIVRTYRLKK